MREILFRAKDNGVLNGIWQYGSLDISNPDAPEINSIDRHNNKMRIPVLIKTVGQYTGLTDKNGKKIFEGDIVMGLFLHSCPVKSVVSFQDGAFGLLWERAGVETFWAFTSICNVEYEVIGNIHDNPELLEGE